MSNIYLAHHGIIGQKWGVRRFQNPDGSLTAAGKKKYLLDSDGNLRSKKKYFKNNSGEVKKINRKNLKDFDYEKSEQYKSHSGKDRTYEHNKYLGDSILYGETAAKKLALVRDRGGNAKIAASKEFIKQAGLGLIVTEEIMSKGAITKAGAKFVSGSVKKTIAGSAARKAARDATTKIGAKSLKKVAKNVYEWR